MNEYQIGKDIQSLEDRIVALESKIGEGVTRVASDIHPIALKSEFHGDEPEGLVESKTWVFPVHRLNHCELRDGASLTLFPDGLFRVVGKRKCNAGGVNKCNSHTVRIAFYRGDKADELILIHNSIVAQGFLGPGGSGSFSTEKTDDILRRLYREIKFAKFWVAYCDTPF